MIRFTALAAGPKGTPHPKLVSVQKKYAALDAEKKKDPYYANEVRPSTAQEYREQASKLRALGKTTEANDCVLEAKTLELKDKYNTIVEENLADFSSHALGGPNLVGMFASPTMRQHAITFEQEVRVENTKRTEMDDIKEQLRAAELERRYVDECETLGELEFKRELLTEVNVDYNKLAKIDELMTYRLDYVADVKEILGEDSMGEIFEEKYYRDMDLFQLHENMRDPESLG
mmetsp:Transcript_2926/g.3274  ORF Transcript_2926/g.3274 Transcript_2926/m.3274 type:complete len:232 (-) Transcript_2926:119-814(-)